MRKHYRRADRSKYHAKKTTIDGITFDSRKEAKRFEELRLLERAGEISELERQVKYVLIPSQREPYTIGPRGGLHRGKLIERECAYIADFTYRTRDGDLVVEDTKGMKTAEYVIKRKLMLYVHGIRIKEI